MKSFYLWMGGIIDNYVVMFITLCVFTRIITILLNIVSKKQNKQKAIRDAYCKELQKQFKDDKEGLTNAIYEYYKEIKYNPLFTYASRFFVIALNIALIVVLIGFYSPISNFTNISNEDISKIVSLYDGKYYAQIGVLNNIYELKDELLAAGVGQEVINTLFALKERFLFLGIETDLIPLKMEASWFSILPIFVLGLNLYTLIWPWVNSILKLKKEGKNFKSLNTEKKAQFMVRLSLNLILLALVWTTILNAPIVVCFYFIVNKIITLIYNFTAKKIQEKRGAAIEN